MKTKFLWAAMALVLLAGCQKYGGVGRTIRFSAVTRTAGGAGTRTSYSGEVTANKERIDWLNGDQIILAMKNGSGMESQTYSITGPVVSAGSSYSSESSLEPDSEGLQWGEGSHDFWAAYPASKVTVGDHTLSASILDVQVANYARTDKNVIIFNPDMSLAFMYAGLQSEPAESIELDFYPAFNCFDFTVGANSDITIDHFEMETTTSGLVDEFLSGTTLVSFESANMSAPTVANTGTSQKITVNFDDGKGNTYRPTISATTSLNFKVLALPRDIQGVRITFFLADGRKFSLNMKEDTNWIIFGKATKANITGLMVPGAKWYIHFDYPREEQWIDHSDAEIEIGVE